MAFFVEYFVVYVIILTGDDNMYENITSKLFELLDEIKNQIAKIEIDEQGNISKVGIDLINKPFKEMVSDC